MLRYQASVRAGFVTDPNMLKEGKSQNMIPGCVLSYTKRLRAWYAVHGQCPWEGEKVS